mgnify:CR=1 FL=1
MATEHNAGRNFLGVFYAGPLLDLVALFEDSAGRTRYYMTLSQLCDRVERQMNTGAYIDAPSLLKADRTALMALIEAQRDVLIQKSAYRDFPPLQAEDRLLIDRPPAVELADVPPLIVKD